MGAATLISVEEYLNTSYSPDREYRDGVLVERNVREEAHADLQSLLVTYLRVRGKRWNIRAYTELRVRVREKWYPIPDVCVYSLPRFEGRYPTTPPLLWIEIVSRDDRNVNVWGKADELVANGVPFVWIIDPFTLESKLRTPGGLEDVPEKSLHLPGTEIVIPLLALEE